MAFIDESSASSLIDQAFDTANSGLDLWKKWSGAKIDNATAKAAIPSTIQTTTPAPAFGMDQKTLVIVGVVLAVGAAIAVPLLLQRRSKK